MKKHKNFVLKLVSLAIVLGAIAGYNRFFQEKNEIDALAEAEYEEQLAELNSRKAALEAEETEAGTEAEAEAETASAYQDGVYTGEAKGYGGTIQVEVTVDGGQIAAIEIVSAEKEDAAYLEQAVAVIDDMLAKQSSSVDTVSGATFSSTGIINAVTLALEDAK